MNPTEQTTATLQATKTPKRVIVLNALQIVGILTAALTVPSPETAAVLAALPAALAAHIGKLAILLLAAKPGINLIGDLADNGKIDGSWKDGQAITRAFVAMFACLCFAGCSLKIEPPDTEGCFLITQGQAGKTYSFGPCAGADGKIYAYRALWTNADGVKLRSTCIITTKVTSVEYSQDGGKIWIKWDSKAGISLDGLPETAQATSITNDATPWPTILKPS